ncbi:class I SAM-dependent methyltransferase [Phycicoccus sp. CSK15P-2]|uniref:class I SAM-dependent methyltransferase n=1 Tax=Phycicoccus sp. CSK15P-2 TaxID=2807627 RepID=UPI0019504ECB|nr:class I SAM-dependent methyltransferase [Phycicoccus sp. CSK15P-2]MBM6404275.1 class I SAM-dependent methyltransferase [Phycicoccus sp. CSK15P-2]
MTSTTPRAGSASIGAPNYWWYVARAELLEVTLRDRTEEAALALDLGSADGPSASWLRDAVHRTVSLDVDPRGLGSDGVCGSALALPFEDETFDVVAAFDVIEHCDPEHDALAEVFRVLRPGGAFVMSVPAYTWAWTDFDIANGHHRRYTRTRAVTAVERAGFRVQRCTYAFASVFPLFAAERALRKLRRLRADGPVDIVQLPQVSPLANRALTAVARADRFALSRGDLPFGSSVFLAATRP